MLIFSSSDTKAESRIFTMPKQLSNILFWRNKSQESPQSSQTGQIARVTDLNDFAMQSEGDEDAVERYITLIKKMARELSPETLLKYYDSEKKPVLRTLLELSHHEDTMIRNAARISLLTIFKKCKGATLEFVVEAVVPYHVESIVRFLRCTIFEIQNASLEGNNNWVLRALWDRFQEEVEYVDDVLGLNIASISSKVCNVLRKSVIMPVLISTVINADASLDSQKCLLPKIGFLLLARLLAASKNRNLWLDVYEICTPSESSENQEISIKIGERYRNVKKELKVEMTKHIIDIISNAEPPFLFALWFLKSLFEKAASSGDSREFLFLCATFTRCVMKNFNESCEFGNLKLNIAFSILKLVSQECSKKITDSEEPIFCDEFSGFVRDLYLETCHRVQFGNKIFFTHVDAVYSEFTKTRSRFEVQTDEVDLMMAECRTPGDGRISKTGELLYKLFYLRHLCLCLGNKEEKILPLMQGKIQTGDSLSLQKSLECKKMVYKDNFVSDHFLKLTTSQVVILQSLENNRKGIVIFCVHYSDIRWSIYDNNCLLLWNYSTATFSQNNPTKIQLQFENSADIYSICDLLSAASNKQNEILQRKFDDLLEIDFDKSNLIENVKCDE